MTFLSQRNIYNNKCVTPSPGALQLLYHIISTDQNQFNCNFRAGDYFALLDQPCRFAGACRGVIHTFTWIGTVLCVERFEESDDKRLTENSFIRPTLLQPDSFNQRGPTRPHLPDYSISTMLRSGSSCLLRIPFYPMSVRILHAAFLETIIFYCLSFVSVEYTWKTMDFSVSVFEYCELSRLY